MMIEVTENHIAFGEESSANLCPVALAIRERTRRKVRVNRHQISFGPREHVATPRSVAQFVTRFDNGDPVKPFRFRLEATS